MTKPSTKKSPSKKKDLAIEYLDPTNLDVYANNSRSHSPEQIQQIVRSIEEFGFTNPILIDPDNTIIAGHARHEASLQLALQKVPTIRLPHLSPEQIRAYVIADNKLAENASWNEDLLKAEMQKLQEAGFDMLLTGFQDFELDDLLKANEIIQETEEIIHKQTIQIEPPQEYIVILAKDAAEWDEMIGAFKLEKVRRGGYKVGSPMDQSAIERILTFDRVKQCLSQSQVKAEQE